MKTNFKTYWNDIIDFKKFILLYLAFVLIFSLGMLSTKNYSYPKFEIIFIAFISILGIIILPPLLKNKNNLPKIVFILIILFGLMMVFLAPPLSFPDESTHFTRAELITEGVLFPPEGGFYVQNYFFPLNNASSETTILNNNYLSFDIVNSIGYWEKTTTTPFYTYILSAIGIIIAKCLNLIAMGALWLARIANLIFYGVIAYISIKKIPKYKIPLAVFACAPLSIAIASSVSYDAFIITLFLLVIAYFIKMYETKVEITDLIIFIGSILLISLIKQPYCLFIFLLLLIPRENFKTKRIKEFAVIGIGAFILILLISVAIRIPSLMALIKGTSSTYTVSTTNSVGSQNASISGQLMYLLAHPYMILNIGISAIKDLPSIFITDLNLYHYGGFKGTKGFNLLYLIFILAFSLFYPHEIDLSKFKRFLLLMLTLVTYFGFFFILYLTWNSIGSTQVLGIQGRYFLPLLPLLPLILRINPKKIKMPKIIEKDLDLWILTIITIFLLGMVLLTVTHFY